MANPNAFLDVFKKLGPQSLKSSMFEFDGQPHYSLLSEGLDDTNGPSSFDINPKGISEPISFDLGGIHQQTPNPISEVSPAENTAQQWTRKAKTGQTVSDLLGKTDNFFSADAGKPSAQRTALREWNQTNTELWKQQRAEGATHFTSQEQVKRQEDQFNTDLKNQQSFQAIGLSPERHAVYFAGTEPPPRKGVSVHRDLNGNQIN